MNIIARRLFGAVALAFRHSLWQRANARNVSLEIICRGNLSLINFRVLLPYRRGTTVFLETESFKRRTFITTALKKSSCRPADTHKFTKTFNIRWAKSFHERKFGYTAIPYSTLFPRPLISPLESWREKNVESRLALLCAKSRCLTRLYSTLPPHNIKPSLSPIDRTNDSFSSVLVN